MKKRLGLLMLALLALTACGGEKKEGMTLRFNNGTDPQTLDPAIMTGQPEGRIALQIFEGLTVYNPETLEPAPGVAERWEMSRDGKTYTFYLRTNAVWSDGVPVTAETFRYSFLRTLAPATAAEYAYHLWVIKNAEAYTRGQTNPEAVGIDVVDTHTLRIRLEAPTAFFLDLTSFHSYLPVPQHKVEAFGNRWTRPENIACNGPFVLKEWKSKSHVKMAKNPAYWDKDRVKLNTLYFYAYEEPATALEMFLNHELDWVDSVPTERIEAMKKHPDFQSSPYLGTYFYNLNVTDPVLKDVRVRRALSLSIDRESICEYVLKLGQIPAYGFVPAFMPGYVSPVKPQKDAALAKKLLAEAGYPDGKGFPALTILYNTMEDHKKIAEALQRMWMENLGIQVSLENQEWKVYLQRTQTLDYQIARRGWIADYQDPNTFLDMFVSGGGNNQTGWSNVRYDQLIRSAGVELNPKKRQELFYQAEKLLMDDCPIIPLYTYVRATMRSSKIHGVYPNTRDIHPLKEVWIEE